MASAFRLFRGSPSTSSSASRPSSRDASESPTKRKSTNSTSSISKHARTVTDGDVTSSPTTIDGPNAESAAAGLERRGDQGQGVPSIEVTSSSPSVRSANFASESPEQSVSPPTDAPPGVSSLSQKRRIHAQGFSEGGPGLTQLKTSKSAKRASRVGMSEDQHQGPVSAVEWGSGGPGGHSRYASAGPLTAGANRHDVMRRAQNFASGLEDSSEEEDDDDDDGGEDARDEGHEGGYDDIADGRKLNQASSATGQRPGAPGRARSNSDTELPLNHPHHHASLPPMPHTALHSGHIIVTPKEEGDQPSHAPMFDTVPGEGSLTLDHILGTTGPEIVTVDGAVRPGSSIGHGAELSASRRTSINRGAAASSQGHGSAIGEFGQMMKVNGKLAAAKDSSGNSLASQGSMNAGPPLALTTSGTSKPAEALLSPAQVGANGKQQSSPNKKRPSLGPKSGIAGALAASGMTAAGTSVSGLTPPPSLTSKGSNSANGVPPSRSPSPAAVAALTPGLGAEAPNGFQGGIYRNPSTGQIREVGEGQQGDEFFAPMSRESSGLTAAAQFQPGNAPLISPMVSSKSMSAATNNVSEFAGGLGMDLAAAMADNPALAPDSANMDGGVSSARRSSVNAIPDDVVANWHDGHGIETQITGFAVASSKRNADFHGVFQSVPEDDYLIEDYGCALVREILVHGRLYISENHLCFNSNIFGWVTNVVVPFSEIVSIEKRMTAFVIPNAIQIATLHAKHTFASFLSRDTTYDLIVNIWKLSHPSLPQNHTLDHLDLSEEEEPAEGEDDSSKARLSKRTKLRKKFLASRGAANDGGDADANAEGAETQGKGDKGEKGDTSVASAASGASKKAAHKPTTCPCDKDKAHYQTIALDAVYPAKPEKIYSLLFTSGFMKEFWTGNQKLTELQMSDWSPNSAHGGLLSRSLSYIKPLAGGFGPKQTKCMITDENLHVDFDDYVCTLTTTKTPDVPSGNSFAVKTRTCFTWAGGNTTKVYVTCTVEWSGRSMLKGIIEKACIDGQKQYYKDLDAAIRENMKKHPSEFKEEGDEDVAVEDLNPPTDKAETDTTTEQAKEANGQTATTTAPPSGMLETISDMASSSFFFVLDQLKEASPSHLALGAVVVLLLFSNIWAWSGSRGRVPNNAQRLRAERYRSGRSDDPDAVAQALRGVLQDLLQPGEAVPKAAQFKTPAQELEHMLATLDYMEQRIGKLRGTAAQAAKIQEEL